jgi:hypothetical protein
LLEFVAMIDIEVTVTAEHERVITSLFIGVDNRSTSYSLHCFIHQ